MNPRFELAIAVMLVAAGFAENSTASPRVMEGQFTFLDASMPGCGAVAWASRARFKINGSGEAVELRVPCIEMQLVEGDEGQTSPLKVGEPYRIVVAQEAPLQHLMFPYSVKAEPLYLAHAARLKAHKPIALPKPTSQPAR